MLYLIGIILGIYILVKVVVPYLNRPMTRTGMAQTRQGLSTMRRSAVEMYQEKAAARRASADQYRQYRTDGIR